MLSTNRVQFCFIEESLVDVNDYQIIVFSQILEYKDRQEEEDYNP